jgi:hypothetical protein
MVASTRRPVTFGFAANSRSSEVAISGDETADP